MADTLHWLQALDNDTIKENKGMRYFYNCSFTDSHTVQERWCVNLTVTHTRDDALQLHIPSFVPLSELWAPPHPEYIECHIVAAGAMAQTGAATGSCSAKLRFNYNENEIAAQVIDLALPTPKGSLLRIAISLEYKLYGNMLTTEIANKMYMPARVVDALYV